MDFLNVCCSFSGALCCTVWRNVFVYSVQHLFFLLFPCKPGIPHTVNTATVTHILNISKTIWIICLKLCRVTVFTKRHSFWHILFSCEEKKKNEWSYLVKLSKVPMFPHRRWEAAATYNSTSSTCAVVFWSLTIIQMKAIPLPIFMLFPKSCH